MRALGVVVLVVACGGTSRHAPTTHALRSTRLPAPMPVDPAAHGASYLTAVAGALQPPWSQFLEDCRLRLSPSHPLNAPALQAMADLAIDRRGRLTDIAITTSGNADFDLAVREILAEVPQLPVPPIELVSDDERAHVRWLFARDRRQAGPATATLVTVTLPLLAVADRLVASGDLARAARRVAAAPASDPDRGTATERVMIAALHEALVTGGGARVAAVDAIGHARVRALAPDVRALLAPTIGTAVRLRAIAAVTALGDDTSVPTLLAELSLDLPAHADLALAETAALVALGRREQAATAIRAVLEDRHAPQPIALAAHALAPSTTLEPSLSARFARARTDRALRAAVCTAIAGEHPDVALIDRGLRDADARVRAACVDAAARALAPRSASKVIVRRVLELVNDLDATVRARAVHAAGILDPGHDLHRAADRSPEVRLAAVAAATDPELRALVDDPDAEVRAAAVAAMSDRDAEIPMHAAHDAAPQVRRAAVAALTDEDALQELARDAAPEVATAALVRLTGRRGRAATTVPLLTGLAAAPAGSADRVRIALAWLLGP